MPSLDVGVTTKLQYDPTRLTVATLFAIIVKPTLPIDRRKAKNHPVEKPREIAYRPKVSAPFAKR